MNSLELIRDLSRKYSETYIHARIDGADKLMWCSSIQPQSSGGGRIFLNSPSTGELIYNLPSTIAFNFKFPNIGTFQCGREAAIFKRSPRRQWRRGVCPANAVVTAITYHGRTGNMTHETLEAAYKGVTYSPYDAFQKMQGDMYLSVAISGDFALTRAPGLKDDEVHLYYWSTPIAVINFKKEVKHIFDDSFASVITTFMEQI